MSLSGVELRSQSSISRPGRDRDRLAAMRGEETVKVVFYKKNIWPTETNCSVNECVIDKVLQTTTNIFYNDMAMLMKPELMIGLFIRQKDIVSVSPPKTNWVYMCANDQILGKGRGWAGATSMKGNLMNQFKLSFLSNKTGWSLVWAPDFLPYISVPKMLLGVKHTSSLHRKIFA